MATSNIPTARVTRDVFEAMFPNAVRGGSIDLNQVLRDCQFSARAILTAVDPDRNDGGDLDQGQAIAVAKSFVNASIAVLGCIEVHGWPARPVVTPEALIPAEA